MLNAAFVGECLNRAVGDSHSDGEVTAAQHWPLFMSVCRL